MDIHEYQAKELLAQFGVAVAPGAVAFSPDQAVYAATELGGSHWVVKAQIHAGARGKAGGVKLCRTYHEVRQAAQDLLGKRLVTTQTGPEGKPVQRVYIEVAEPFEREILSRLRARPQSRARPRHRLASTAAWRSRRSPRHEPDADPPGGRRAGGRPAGLPGARTRLPARPQHQAGRARGARRSWAPIAPSAIATRPCSRSTRWSSPRTTTCSRSTRRCRSTTTRCSAAATSPTCTIPRSRIRARRRPPSTTSTISASTARSAASSTAPASPWRRWT